MNDKLTIHVYRRENGWESNIFRGYEELGGCTSPTLAGCIDTTHEIITDSDPEWADFDANEDSRKRHMYQVKHSKNAEIVEAPVVASADMQHKKLLGDLDDLSVHNSGYGAIFEALYEVVKLHNPNGYHHANVCDVCDSTYPCLTVRTIEKELCNDTR